ncbi:amino acid adenylation domain-containing protein [Nocardia sp. R16R-3T]
MNAPATPTGNGPIRSRGTDPFPSSSGQAEIWTAQRRPPEVPSAPSCAVGDLPVLDPVERAELCPIVSDPAEPPATLAALLTTAVERNRTATAVRFLGLEVSYGELDKCANRLARVLIAEGIGAEQVVAVALPRSIDAIAAIWAIAKTGAAYLPIDHKYPPARIEAMSIDAGVRIGLTTTNLANALPCDLHWLPIDSAYLEKRCAATSAAAVRAEELTARPRLDHPAYLSYTSGPTGRPKAVVVTHRGLSCLGSELVQRFGLGAATRSLHFASPRSDTSIFELLPAFMSGATVIVVPEDVYCGVELARLLRAERVDCAFITPATLATLDPTELDDLSVIAVGDDERGPELIAAWADSSRAVFKAYGPTEVTVATAISAPMRTGEPVHIGSAVRGMRMLVLDSRLHPVPVGVPGELYLAGPGVARGYYGRPGLSASRFVADPYAVPGAEGQRMYRTGDLVCLDADRTLRFLGRDEDRVVPDAAVAPDGRSARDADAGQHHPRFVAEPRPDPLPLAAAQQRIWFRNQYDTISGAYSAPIAIRLRGELDITALRSAMVDVLCRHESLRTRYPELDGMPIQLIEPIDEVDLDLTPTPVPRSRLVTTVLELADRGFDVSAKVPVRIRLFRIDTGEAPEYVLVVVVHHIAADGFSMTPVVRDITTAYTARIQGRSPSWTPPPVRYAHYALWQHATLGSPDDPESLFAEQLRYWAQTLEGVTEELCLPTDRPRPAVASRRGATVDHTLDDELIQMLARFARERGTSLFTVVHSTLAVLCARLSGIGDIAIGTPVTGRGPAALDDVVGVFVNTLVLRTEIDLGESFTDLLSRVARIDLDAFDHADIPFEQLVDELGSERSQSRHPLFQVMLACQNREQAKLELPGLDVSMVDLPDEISHFDLRIVLSDDNENTGMTAAFTYATDLFDAATIESFIRRWIRILESVATDPTTPVGAIEILEPAERADLLSHAGAPALPPVVLADLLTTAVTQNPDATAIAFDNRQLTYRELDERSNRLARVLIALGAGPENVVAVGIPRSLEFVLAIWATAKSGAALLALDPNQPAERITYMLADSGASIGLTATSVRAKLPDGLDWSTLDDLEDITRDPQPITDAERTTPLRPQHPAYMRYTSGCTGAPKGVVVTHTGVADLVAETRARFRLGPTSRLLAAAAATFEISILEWLSTAAAGATLVLAPASIVAGTELTELITTEDITHIALTPAVLTSIHFDGLDALDTIILGGGICPPDLAAQWLPGCAVVHTYGAPETTIMACAEALCTPAGQVTTIGSPIRGLRAVVLDRRLRPVPRGVIGELYLSGPGLARGYHQRPATTAIRFVPDLYGPAGTRMYRTGDLVTWTADRTLQYKGRVDLQVETRGPRVEPDIESALRSHPDGFTVDTRANGADQLVG